MIVKSSLEALLAAQTSVTAAGEWSPQLVILLIILSGLFLHVLGIIENDPKRAEPAPKCPAVCRQLDPNNVFGVSSWWRPHAVSRVT